MVTKAAAITIAKPRRADCSRSLPRWARPQSGTSTRPTAKIPSSSQWVPEKAWNRSEAASAVTGAGCRRVRRVAAHATPLAANPLESALRAAAVEAGLSNLVPQLLISEDGLNYYVDLGDEKARIAAEADSFTYHGTPEALARDCRRYDELVTRGWLLLRFSHDQTIFDDRWVKEKLIDAYRVQASHFGGSKRSRTRKHPPPGN